MVSSSTTATPSSPSSSNFRWLQLVMGIVCMTLLPGDLICCGTSVGVGVMKEQVNTVTVAIDGIGELTNEFRL